MQHSLMLESCRTRWPLLTLIVIIAVILNWPIAWLCVLFARVSNPGVVTMLPITSATAWPAWVSREWPPFEKFTSQDIGAITTEKVVSLPQASGWRIMGANTTDAVMYSTSGVGIAGLHMMAVDNTATVPLGSQWWIDELRYGIPLQSVFKDSAMRVQPDGVRIFEDFVPTFRVSLPSKSYDMPLMPKWLPLIGNTFIYGCAMWFIRSAARYAVMASRRKRSRCISCGYKIDPLTRCPECGRASS